MDVFRIVIFACVYLLLPILFLVLRSSVKPKKNVVLGVTLPYAVRDSEAVQSICGRFKKNLNIMFLTMTLLCVAGIAIPYQSVMFTYEMLWLVFVLAVPFLIYAKAHSALKRLKAVNGWGGGMRSAGALPEFNVKRIGRVWFVIPVLICLVPCVWAFFLNGAERWVVLLPGIALALTAVLMAAVYEVTNRRPREVLDGRPELEQALTEVRRQNRGRCFLFVSWATSIYALVFLPVINNSVLILSASALYTILLLYGCLRAEFETRKAQEKLTADSGVSGFIDDDAHWLWGILYCNREDTHNIVDSRMGMGTTVNLAKPLGKALVVFAVVCMAALPFLGVWLMNEEFTPIRVEFDGSRVTASHLTREFTIAVDEVEKAELIQKLPSKELPRASKIIGTNMESVCKGQFKVEGYGTCLLCLDPRSDVFLVLVAEGNTYILSGEKELLESVADAVRSRAD